jgi:predicted ArsR family transcriptional regulator
MRKIRAKPIISKIIKLLASGGYIREYKEMDGGNKILMSCPFHKAGQENRPSCVLNFSEYT